MSYRIVVVEDDFRNRDVTSRRPELRGSCAVAAVGGLEGMAMARTEAPDLILMDVNLPAIDGGEATRRPKAEAATRHIPIVAPTAHAMASDRDEALRAGCDESETKPLDFPRLLAKVEALLGREVTS